VKADHKPTTLSLSKIRMDGGTQPRAGMDSSAIEDYTEAMLDGAQFPPVVVFHDGADYWLADGFHRCKAAFDAKMPEIACDIQRGTQQDAQWYSFSANKTNGLRRTSEDKQHAVKEALAHPYSADKSDEKIASHVGCSGEWVRRIRAEMVSSNQLEDRKTRTVTRNGTTYQQNTANIGRKRKADSPQIDKQQIANELLRAFSEIANHEISATEFVHLAPDRDIDQLCVKTRAAYEFARFAFDAVSKRLPGGGK
jgi:hypothetical protein